MDAESVEIGFSDETAKRIHKLADVRRIPPFTQHPAGLRWPAQARCARRAPWQTRS